jgi:aryl-alcohol dehydrogenase-like predicted oxidoreductase
MMVIFSLFEPYPGEVFYWGARLAGTGMTARVSDASGMLAGYYRPGMNFPDHRAYRTKADPAWIEKAVRRCESLAFLTETGRTLAQAALRYTLDRFPDVSVSTVPTLYNDPEAPPMDDRIDEYAAISDVPRLSAEELEKIEDLRRTGFGVLDEAMALKGAATVAAPEPQAVAHTR